MKKNGLATIALTLTFALTFAVKPTTAWSDAHKPKKKRGSISIVSPQTDSDQSTGVSKINSSSKTISPIDSRWKEALAKRQAAGAAMPTTFPGAPTSMLPLSVLTQLPPEAQAAVQRVKEMEQNNAVVHMTMPGH